MKFHDDGLCQLYHSDPRDMSFIAFQVEVAIEGDGNVRVEQLSLIRSR